MKTYKTYIIINKINGKKYIGMTGIKYPSTRKGQHLHALRKGKHDNDHLQFAFNEYGESAFEFKVIDTDLTEEQVLIREDELMKIHNTLDREYGYNIEKSGNVVFLSEESKIKIRNKLKGRKISDEQKRKHSELMKSNNPMKGKSHSAEAREKIRQACLKRSPKSRVHSEETKMKISEANKGKIVSEETRIRMSIARKGKPLTEKQRAALAYAREHTQWAKKKKSQIK
jgi:group I intron endonuclease